ncbi:MAG: hypothetical protein ACJ79S_09220 [Gemmatimonadaceae bacterium]
MTHKILRRGAAALVAVTLLAACDDTPDVVKPKPVAGGDLFRSYVALGNSITAGFQSGGINDSTQRESYAVLLAQQAGLELGRTFTYPAFAAPGCPAPATQTLQLNPPQSCGLRNVALETSVLNNVAVPNAFAWDLTRNNTPTAPSNPLQTFILGGRTQIRRALEAQPTFASVWIGNNDVLAAASVGVLTPVAGASPGLIPADTVIKYIRVTIDTLKQAPTLKGGVLIGPVDVPNAPRFFAGSALFTALGTPSQLQADIVAATGQTVTVFPNCINSPSLISSIVVERIKAGSYPPYIACDTTGVPPTLTAPPALVGELFVLSALEQAAISAQVAKVNAYARAKADSAGFAYFDPNNATNGLAALRAAGAIPAVPSFTDPKNPYGTYISFDGIHPRRPAHVAMANALIDVINAKYKTTIPKIGG